MMTLLLLVALAAFAAWAVIVMRRHTKPTVLREHGGALIHQHDDGTFHVMCVCRWDALRLSLGDALEAHREHVHENDENDDVAL